MNFSLHLSIDLNFRHTSKKIEGGSPKKNLEKKNVFPKKYVELRTFDGMYRVVQYDITLWMPIKNKNEPFSLLNITVDNALIRYKLPL